MTQITGYDERTDTVSTLPLWGPRPGQRWAQPINEPVGLVADVYRSPGVAAAAEAGAR